LRDDTAARKALFWQLADALLVAGAATRGTMMGFPCLRADGRFFASVEPRTGELIVKLPSARVLALIQEGIGQPFAPNGRVFREWVAVSQADPKQWSQLLAEAQEFAANG
jgi:hypothetical protein